MNTTHRKIIDHIRASMVLMKEIEEGLARQDVKFSENDKMFNVFVRQLTNGCSGCDFEEATGELFRHCSKCQLSLTSQAYELFVTRGVKI
jgi:hypothetical protein